MKGPNKNIQTVEKKILFRILSLYLCVLSKMSLSVPCVFNDEIDSDKFSSWQTNSIGLSDKNNQKSEIPGSSPI